MPTSPASACTAPRCPGRAVPNEWGVRRCASHVAQYERQRVRLAVWQTRARPDGSSNGNVTGDVTRQRMGPGQGNPEMISDRTLRAVVSSLALSR